MSELVLKVQRQPTTDSGTLGNLDALVDGVKVYSCYTLEDKVRAPGVKVWGDTAIPAGTYAVRLSVSDRFRRELPEVLGVLGFSGVRMHGGNTNVDTHGCLLLGTEKWGPTKIGICAPAVNKVSSLIRAAAKSTLEIKDA